MKKILTLVLDGLGLSNDEKGNAFKAANMPILKGLMEKYPNSKLQVSGTHVGLAESQVGNEMVGYSTLAAGEIIKQRSSFAHDFIDIDSLETNGKLKDAIENVRKNRSTFHIIGLMSDAGIESNIDDVIKIIEFLKKQEIKIGVDFIADGKDVEAKSAIKYIERIESTGIPIISVCGRYYAMDEEGKWDRTKIYYDLVRNGIGLKVKEIGLALKNCYMRNITDEFLPPMLLEQDRNIKDKDSVLWINYKEEGSLQILTSLVNGEAVSDFQTLPLKNTMFLSMYNVSDLDITALINEESDTSNSLGIYLSKLDLSQARIADNTTYEYVTNYFNGETTKKLSKCTNYLVDVPKTIPGREIELDAAGVTRQIIKCMEKDTDFILASISAADQVGRTGNFEKTVYMLEFIDECLGKIMENAELNFYTVVILSLYGKVESMIDKEGKPITTRTTNETPLIITDSKIKLENGCLTDVAPTILKYMDISIPESMKKSNILIKE